jgi:hypothetical protein
MSYIRLASERIRVQNYKVKPLRLILFQRGVLGSDRLYKGVKVFPIESPPPRDFNIDLEDSTFYMDPLVSPQFTWFLITQKIFFIRRNSHFEMVFLLVKV